MADTFDKLSGNCGLKGVQFQLKLLIVFLLNALRNHKNKKWRISSDDKKAGKLDDIVFELGGRRVFLQAKYKQDMIIARKHLLSPSKKGDFSLPKYFFEYLDIKSNFGENPVIICTNAKLNEKGLENVLIRHSADKDNLLHCEGATCSFFTLNEDILPDLKASAEIYFDKNLQGKSLDKKVITDENLTEFLKNLEFFYNYPSRDKHIKKLLSLLDDPWCKTASNKIYQKVENWFLQRKGEYLTERHVKAMLCEIRSDKFCASLKEFNNPFDSADLDIANLQRINVVKVTDGHLLQILKIYCTLQAVERIKLFVNPEDTMEVQKQTVEAFSLRRYSFLVLVWTAIKDETVKSEIISEIGNILSVPTNNLKKIILVGADQFELEKQFQLKDVYQFDVSVTFQCLSKKSQERLLKTKNVLFQGDRVNLEELLRTQKAEDYTKSLNSTMLERLIKGKDVKVGVRPPDLDEGTVQYYVSRKFKTDAVEKEDEQNILIEGKLCDIKKKITVISDSAGMGKTTVLTKMAMTIKRTNPSLWVMKINLNDYTRVLKDFVEMNKTEITAAELLNSQEATKLTNEFEKLVFTISKKVVLMLDGVDEISPDYTHLVLSLLNQCQAAPNFANIFVTTKPHVNLKLKLKQVGLFKMLPFTKSEQTDFLTNYWMHNLKLSDQKKERCKQYAMILIEKMSSRIKSDTPLQMKMLADIFQDDADWEGCRVYVEGDRDEPKLPEKVNIAKLCHKLIEMKKVLFTNKECPSGDVMSNQALLNLFDTYLAYHRSLAIIFLLPEPQHQELFEIEIPDDKIKNYIVKIGILQNVNEDVVFVNNLFPEFFLADSIVKELELQNRDAKFLQFLIDEVLTNDKFEKVRALLDDLLGTLSIPTNTFKQYLPLKCEKAKSNLIFQLAREGHAAILRLILDSDNFKVTKDGTVTVTYWWLRMPFRKMNTLNDLQILVQQARVNIRNQDGETPLHLAVKGGHLEMVDFLLEQGADINAKDSESRTALNLATYRTDWKIVKCLVEHDSDIDTKDCWGFKALHQVIIMGTLNIVGSLMMSTADISETYNEHFTAQLLAIYRESSNIVKYLVKNGIDVDVTDQSGFTALHHAIVVVALDIVAHVADAGDNEGLTAVHVTNKLNKTDIIEFFLKHGLNVNSKTGENPWLLQLATYWNHLKVAESA